MNWEVLKERCLASIRQGRQERCVKLIRLRAVGMTLFVELVKRDPDNGEEDVKDLAHLPRETYYVSEPYFGEFFAAFESGKLIATSWGWGDWNNFLRRLKARGYYVGRDTYLSASKILIRHVKKTVSAGLSDDGEVVDPLKILDKTDYGAEPLRAAYEWIKSAYTGRNVEYAWYNVITAITHVATSPLRDQWYLKSRFIDYVVYNVAPYGYNVVTYVLEKLLGGFHAFNEYHTVVYDVLPKAYILGRRRMAAALLDLNRLPLVLANQTKKTLKIYKYVLETAGGDFIVLDKQGKKRIPNLRGLIIFADDLYKIPTQRRLVLRWDPQAPRLDTLSMCLRQLLRISASTAPAPLGETPPPIKPIYGFAARLWRKYRNRFSTINMLPHLVEVVATAVAQEIHDEAEEVATFTERTVDSLTDAFIRAVRQDTKLDDVVLS